MLAQADRLQAGILAMVTMMLFLRARATAGVHPRLARTKRIGGGIRRPRPALRTRV